MTTIPMWPPSDGSRNTVFLAGRSYFSTPGVSIQAQPFDVAALESNGWSRQTPSSVPATLGAGVTLRLNNDGWQPLTARPGNLHGSSLSATPANTVSGSLNCYTSRILQRALFGTEYVSLDFGNWYLPAASTSWENPSGSPIRISAALEVLGAGGVTDESGARVQVTFNGGHKYVIIPPGGVVRSDPTPFPLAAGTQFFVRTVIYVSGQSALIPGCYSIGGGTFSGNFRNGDGVLNTDVLMSGTVGQLTQRFVYGPLALWGQTTQAVPTAILVGDSQLNSTGDSGHFWNDGGWGTRFFQGQTVVAWNFTSYLASVPVLPFLKATMPGAKLSDALNQISFKHGRELIKMASTVVSNFGINDISAAVSLATMQANMLAFANEITKTGRMFIQATILPHTTTSDGWVLASNQTVTGQEAVRTALNSWLRDTSWNGFVAQCANPLLVKVWDAASFVEVNASNVLTLNGGFWPASLGTLITSTTTTASGSSITDSTQTPTTDQYRGLMIRFTSGAASGINVGIQANNGAGTFTLQTTVSPAPGIGDGYIIYQPATLDGLHPSSIGHNSIANGLLAANALAGIV